MMKPFNFIKIYVLSLKLTAQVRKPFHIKYLPTQVLAVIRMIHQIVNLFIFKLIPISPIGPEEYINF